MSVERTKSRAGHILSVDSSAELAEQNITWKARAKLTIGASSMVTGHILFEREGASVTIGNRVFMNGSLIAADAIFVGDDVLISWGVTIVDHNSHAIAFSLREHDVVQWRAGEKDWSHVKINAVRINAKAWIGFNSIILRGITIGEGAIVGAGSVVTRDVPPWTIVAGNPAKSIREIPVDER